MSGRKYFKDLYVQLDHCVYGRYESFLVLSGDGIDTYGEMNCSTIFGRIDTGACHGLGGVW